MKIKKTILTGNQDGFTLIEIIAVLLIFGILAAFAVPKYMDLQNQARIKSAEKAIAEVKARLSNGYGQYLLKNNGTAPADITAICGGINDANTLPVNAIGNVSMGSDHTVSLAADGTITVFQVQGVVLSPAKTATWNMPN